MSCLVAGKGEEESAWTRVPECKVAGPPLRWHWSSTLQLGHGITVEEMGMSRESWNPRTGAWQVAQVEASA